MHAHAIEAQALTKRVGNLVAVDGLSFTVPVGEILGLLGRNGSGKTTTVRMLTSLSRATSGRATVAGFDVVAQATEACRYLGAALQETTLDPTMTGREHLVHVGRLLLFGKRDATTRAEALLESFGLTAAAFVLALTLVTYGAAVRAFDRLDAH